MEKIGIIGTGLMGKGLAKNLIKSGYSVLAHKRKLDEKDPKVIELRKIGAELTESLERIFSSVPILITCLPTSDIIEEMLIGPNGLSASNNTTVRTIIDFSTAKPNSTKKIYAKLKEKGIALIDTPMSGGPKQADEGTVKLICGGDREVFNKMKPLLESVASHVQYAGPAGSGHALKLINNFLGILNQCTTAAVCYLAEKTGISREALYDFISASGGNSWGFQNFMGTIKEGRFGLNFYLSSALKDMRCALDLFSQSEVEYKVLDELVNLFSEAADSGYGNRDIATIYLFMKEKK